MNSVLNNDSILFEYFGEEPKEDVADIDPYESVKKMIVYNKLIDLRARLENLGDPDTEIDEIVDYINIIIQYYDGYGLPEVTNLINGLVDVISKNWKIDVPKALPPEPIEEKSPVEQPQQVPPDTQPQYGQPQQ
jgi:hypothetical protein